MDEILRICLEFSTKTPNETQSVSSIIADSSGTLKSETRYTAFGETRYQSGTSPTNMLYTGQRQEASLDLYFYNARWYDPALGRFTQADIFVANPYLASDYDKYGYVRNNPCNFNDPSGYFTCVVDEISAMKNGMHYYDNQFNCEDWISDLLTELQKSETGRKIYEDFLIMEEKYAKQGGVRFFIMDRINWGHAPTNIKSPTIFIPIKDYINNNMGLQRISSLAHELTHLGQQLHGYTPSTNENEYEAELTAGIVYQELSTLPEYSQFINWETSSRVSFIKEGVAALRENLKIGFGTPFDSPGLLLYGNFSGSSQFAPKSESDNRQFLYISSYSILSTFRWTP